MSDYAMYRVWKKNRPDSGYGGPWTRTDHLIKARTDKEAQSKVWRTFRGFGFTAMSLVAMPTGSDPNQQ